MNLPSNNYSYRRRFFKRFAFVLVHLVIFWLAASFVVAWNLTGRPSPIMAEAAPPEFLGSATQTLRLQTPDHESLGAWFVPGKTDRPAIVLMHGNRATRRAVADVAKILCDAGHPVLMPTMRAHGDSSGEKNDLGYSARFDAIAAVEHLEHHCPNQPIVLFGQSLGAAAALFAAEPLGHRASGLILECPYQNLYAATRNRTRAYLPPGLDLVAYAGLRLVAPIVLPDVERINLVEAASHVRSDLPVLILCGDKDNRAPVNEARLIADRLGDRASMEVVADATHLGLCGCDYKLYSRLVLDFLAKISPH